MSLLLTKGDIMWNNILRSASKLLAFIIIFIGGTYLFLKSGSEAVGLYEKSMVISAGLVIGKTYFQTKTNNN